MRQEKIGIGMQIAGHCVMGHIAQCSVLLLCPFALQSSWEDLVEKHCLQGKVNAVCTDSSNEEVLGWPSAQVPQADPDRLLGSHFAAILDRYTHLFAVCQICLALGT